MDLGSHVRHDGRDAVRFERTYAHPIERVWQSVSDPDELVAWFPSKVSIEPRVGGTIAFSGDPNLADQTGQVLAYDPPHRLAFTWGPDELHLELTAVDDQHCRLVLINVLGDRSAASRNAAGWSLCLAALQANLDATAIDGTSWRAYYDAYVASGMPSGAPFPGAE
jgi:uncharacterized protein YndB with AHSA1/START domain